MQFSIARILTAMTVSAAALAIFHHVSKPIGIIVAVALCALVMLYEKYLFFLRVAICISMSSLFAACGTPVVLGAHAPPSPDLRYAAFWATIGWMFGCLVNRLIMLVPKGADIAES